MERARDSAIISRLFEFEKLAKRSRRRAAFSRRGGVRVRGGRGNKVRIPPVRVLACGGEKEAYIHVHALHIMHTRVSYVRRIDVIDGTRTLSADRCVTVLRTPKWKKENR